MAAESDDGRCTPPELRQIAQVTTGNLIPNASKSRYDATYARFVSWCKDKGVPSDYVSENILLAYLQELSEKYAASTLWSIFSMLKKTIRCYNNLDIGAFNKTEDFLKKLDKTHLKRKSAAFSREQIELFLKTAHDDDFLVVKLVSLFSLFGGLRKSEVSGMRTEDITCLPDSLLVKVPQSKTGPKNFIIVASEDKELDCCALYNKYLLVRQSCKHERLFLRYSRGRVWNQPIGKNTLRQYPRRISPF
jgi:site-specific recombinase XerD